MILTSFASLRVTDDLDGPQIEPGIHLRQGQSQSGGCQVESVSEIVGQVLQIQNSAHASSRVSKRDLVYCVREVV